MALDPNDDLTYRGETAPRRLWTATALTILHPALGYLYVGQTRAAWVFLGGFIAASMAFIALWTALGFFPVLPLAVVFVAWVVMALMSLMGILSEAERLGDRYVLKGFNHPIVYALVYLLGALMPLYGAYHVATQTFWGVVQVNDASMNPALRAGDVVLIDRTAFWGEAPQRGDVVVLKADDAGETHVRLGRILAVAGDEVTLEGGAVKVNAERLGLRVYDDGSATASVDNLPPQPARFIEHNSGRAYLIAGRAGLGAPSAPETIRVDAGKLLIIGDNRAEALDKRLFWKADAAQVLGQPRYILYSSWPEGATQGSGTRWERVGLRVR